MATTQDRKGNSTVNEIEKNRVNRKLDSKEKIVIKALTEKIELYKDTIRELEYANEILQERVKILKGKIERNRDNITE